jgi:hypothetical protein
MYKNILGKLSGIRSKLVAFYCTISNQSENTEEEIPPILATEFPK